MTPDDLLVYLKEIVPYMKEMGRDRLRDLLHLIIKDITIKKLQSPDEKWEIKISPWSYDPRAYSLDVLTGSCYRPSLRHGTFDNTNYFTFPVNAYSHGRNLILDDEYFSILRSKKKQKMETAEERKLRFLHLVNKHNFTRANLARHLGCSRAWVTKVLG